MSDDFKNDVAKIIEDDVIKYLELEIKSSEKPHLKNVLEEFKQKKINTQDILYKLNEMKEFELSKKLFNMIHVHQKNYSHIISIIGRTFF